MKIAYFIDFYPAYSETFIVREILELQRIGFDVRVLARKDTRGQVFSEVIHEDSQQLMNKVYYSPFSKKNSNRLLFIGYLFYLFLLSPLKVIKSLIRVLRKNLDKYPVFKEAVFYAIHVRRIGVKHIHAHFALRSCSIAMFVSELTGIPFSFTMHAHDIFLSPNAKLLTDKFMNAEFVVSISEYNKKFIVKNHPTIDTDKIKIIHCGIDIDKMLESDMPENDRYRILSVGRLTEQKGFSYLIEACRLMTDNQVFNFRCIIIGEGEKRSELEALIRRDGLEKVVILRGAMDQDSVMMELRKADLFVLPCVMDKNKTMDGIPVALMEAMAVGAPVISTDISGIPELIKNGGGKLVPPEDPIRLSRAMEEMINLKYSARKELSKNARAIIEKDFNIKTEVKKLASFITKPHL